MQINLRLRIDAQGIVRPAKIPERHRGQGVVFGKGMQQRFKEFDCLSRPPVFIITINGGGQNLFGFNNRREFFPEQGNFRRIRRENPRLFQYVPIIQHYLGKSKIPVEGSRQFPVHGKGLPLLALEEQCMGKVCFYPTLVLIKGNAFPGGFFHALKIPDKKEVPR